MAIKWPLNGEDDDQQWILGVSHFVSSGQLTVVADVDGDYTPIVHLA